MYGNWHPKNLNDYTAAFFFNESTQFPVLSNSICSASSCVDDTFKNIQEGYDSLFISFY